MAAIYGNRRRVPYSDMVREFAPIAQQSHYAKRNRELEQARIDAEKQMAQNALDQQSQQHADTLAEQQRQYEESIRLRDEELSEAERQHEESLAESGRQFEESARLQEEAASAAESQSNLASGISLAGLGISAYPHVASALGFGGSAAAGAGAGAAAGAGTAVGSAGVAGGASLASGGTGIAAGGTAAGAGGAAAGGSTAGTTALSSLAGPAAAVAIPLAIAYGSGKFQQLGGKRRGPTSRQAWMNTPEAKRGELFNSLSGRQKAGISYEFGDQLTKDQMKDALLSNVGTGFSLYSPKYKPFLASLSSAERNDLLAKAKDLRNTAIRKEVEARQEYGD